MQRSIPLADWELTWLEPERVDRRSMAVREWRAGRVPGCVQSSAWGIPHDRIFLGTAVREVQWMDQVAWIYRVPFRSAGRAAATPCPVTFPARPTVYTYGTVA